MRPPVLTHPQYISTRMKPFVILRISCLQSFRCFRYTVPTAYMLRMYVHFEPDFILLCLIHALVLAGVS